jgi:hypothetical protein
MMLLMAVAIVLIAVVAVIRVVVATAMVAVMTAGTVRLRDDDALMVACVMSVASVAPHGLPILSLMLMVVVVAAALLVSVAMRLNGVITAAFVPVGMAALKTIIVVMSGMLRLNNVTMAVFIPVGRSAVSTILVVVSVRMLAKVAMRRHGLGRRTDMVTLVREDTGADIAGHDAVKWAVRVEWIPRAVGSHAPMVPHSAATAAVAGATRGK